jgi:putative endonuclease
MFHVYAIESSSSKRLYVGHTANLDKRLNYHNLGYVKSTSDDRPWDLIACMEVENRNYARWIERELKKSVGRRKKWLKKYRIAR